MQEPLGASSKSPASSDRTESKSMDLGSTGYAQTSVACRARRASRRTESKIRKVMNWNFCSEFRVETVIEQSTLGQESRLLLTSE
jgi:hypothetical protein